jgi:hypothetical protein
MILVADLACSTFAVSGWQTRVEFPRKALVRRPTTNLCRSVLPQQTAPAPGEGGAASNADSVARPAGYAQFCQNSPALCVPPTSKSPNGDIQFCQNSPVLCNKPN